MWTKHQTSDGHSWCGPPNDMSVNYLTHFDAKKKRNLCVFFQKLIYYRKNLCFFSPTCGINMPFITIYRTYSYANFHFSISLLDLVYFKLSLNHYSSSWHYFTISLRTAKLKNTLSFKIYIYFIFYFRPTRWHMVALLQLSILQ